MNDKQTNPKDAVGASKPPISTIPAPVLFELGNALFEGHLKYGGHNWRAMGVRASVYYDACFRHIAAWWAGQDIDPDSGMSHITKAIAGLVILRDAMIHGMVNDDRPPASPEWWIEEAKARTREIVERYAAVAKTPFMESNRHEWDEEKKRRLQDTFDLLSSEPNPAAIDPFDMPEDMGPMPPLPRTSYFEDEPRVDAPSEISEGRREFLEKDQS